MQCLREHETADLVCLEQPEGESEASGMTSGVLGHVLSVQRHVCRHDTACFITL